MSTTRQEWMLRAIPFLASPFPFKVALYGRKRTLRSPDKGHSRTFRPDKQSQIGKLLRVPCQSLGSRTAMPLTGFHHPQMKGALTMAHMNIPKQSRRHLTKDSTEITPCRCSHWHTRSKKHQLQLLSSHQICLNQGRVAAELARRGAPQQEAPREAGANPEPLGHLAAALRCPAPERTTAATSRKRTVCGVPGASSHMALTETQTCAVGPSLWISCTQSEENARKTGNHPTMAYGSQAFAHELMALTPLHSKKTCSHTQIRQIPFERR